MIPSMASYFEPPDYAELNEDDFDAYADEVAFHVDDMADQYGPPMTAEEWGTIHAAARKAIENNENRLPFPVPDHLQPGNWTPPELDPAAEKMHALGL